MAAVYAYISGNELCSGLQGCNVGDEALMAAYEHADRLGEPVILADDDGKWFVYPIRANGTRQPSKRNLSRGITSSDISDMLL